MMNRNVLYVMLGALCVLVVGGGYALYQERQKPALEINIGGRGVTVQGR